MNPPFVNVPSVDVGTPLQNMFVAFVAYYPTFVILVKKVLGFLVGLSLPLSVFFLIVIVYCVENLKRIRRKEQEIYNTKVEPIIEEHQAGDTILAKRWESIKQHISSENPNDWRQAIMDADIILEDLLTKMGYRGESIGEKLKRVERGDFATLDQAWEAHKIRNQIAHEAGFSLNHVQAKRAVDLYRQVFEEFYYI
jgi:hypothetical protein